jgi:endonuclease YncB( thermonuclease family)
MYGARGPRSYRWMAFACLLALLGPAEADDKALCNPAVIGTAPVRTVLDGRTLLLADGREARLAGIEIAQPDAARAALEAAIAGRDVRLMRLGPETDRYGRISGLINPLAEPRALQLTLLAQGQARVAALVGDRACAADFLAAERGARRAKLGLWAEAPYLTKRADRPAEVLAERGRFAVVEGTVLSVRELGGTIYVNFGRRWTEDFTVTVAKRHERPFSAAGLELKKLSGQRVRVRGTIEERGGPWIEAAHPEQIELAGRE